MAEKGKDLPFILPASHDYGASLNVAQDMRDSLGTSLRQHSLLNDVIVMSPFGDFNTLGYIPRKDIVIPPATCNTPLLLQTFGNPDIIQKASKRTYLVFFKGGVDDKTGSAARLAFLSKTLFPGGRIPERGEVANQQDYLRTLNDSIFCPHIFGTTGWATRLVDSIYAGCIPVLTSDITHPPFHDVLDWSKFSVYIDWREPQDIETILSTYSAGELDRKQAWLLKVRDAFLFDTDRLADEMTGERRGPIFYSLMSLHLKRRE